MKPKTNITNPEKEIECFNFLHREKNRLEKISHVITNTLDNIKQYSQISLLIIKEETTNQELKEQIIKRAKAKNSQVNRQLEKIFFTAQY